MSETQTQPEAASASQGAQDQQEAPQFFTGGAETPPKPQFACIGKVGDIGDVREPDEGKIFYSIMVTLEPLQSGLKKTAFLKFWPEFMTTNPESYVPDFTIEKGADKANDLKRSLHYTMMLDLIAKDGSSLLQGLVGEQKWEPFLEAVRKAHTGNRIEPKTFRDLVERFAKGNPIVYLLKQASFRDDAGKVVYKNDYDLSFVAPLNKTTITNLVKRAKNSAKQKDLRRKVFLRFIPTK